MAQPRRSRIGAAWRALFGPATVREPHLGRWGRRRWEAAKTDRLNQAHWQAALGTTINTDLVSELDKLRNRSTLEAANNPHIEGVIETHATDIIGEAGPSLQVQTDNPRFNELLEEGWETWWKSPDINGVLGGVDLLYLMWRSLWIKGEALVQIVSAAATASAVKTRLLCIDPARLMTPMAAIGDDSVILGVKRNPTGKPLAYYIIDAALLVPTDPVGIPAGDMIHLFRVLEPGQARGVPWAACTLQTVADLRDYDAEVLDAARQAADSGVLLQNLNPNTEVKYIDMPSSADIERRQIQSLPPGWSATQMIPQQPHTRYVDYRRERLRELGRPVGMPLMMVQLDSSGHNYSSARFDGQIYQRMNRRLQAWLARSFLDRLVGIIMLELQRLNELPQSPARVRYQWTWPVPPHVDPLKESEAATERLRNGTSTLRDECAALSRDWEEVIEQRGREREALEVAGLPADMSNWPKSRPTPVLPLMQGNEDEDEDEAVG